MVSWAKRGSLLVAGAANIVAASQPPAAASVSDEIQTEAECMGFLRAFLVKPGDASPAATTAPAECENQIAPISARQACVSVMRSAIWRGSRQSMFSANTVWLLPFSAQPTIQPSG